MISGNGIETYPTLMFVAMNGFVLVARTKLTAGGFERIRSICTKTSMSDLSPETEPRNLAPFGESHRPS